MRKIIIFSTLLAILYSAFSLADTATTAVPAVIQTPAATQTPVNQTTVAVTDRSGPTLQLALQAAFAETLVKMSGDANVMKNPALVEASDNVVQWVQSYSYVEQPNQNPQLPPTLGLQVVFDQTGLQQLLNASTKKISRANSLALPESTVTIMVSGIRNISDYVQVMHALRAKQDVMHVSVKSMQSDHVALQIKLVGNVPQFQELLSSDSNFKSIADLQSSLLEYYWMGNQA